MVSYGLVYAGQAFMWVGFIAAICAVVAFLMGHLLTKQAAQSAKKEAVARSAKADTFTKVGYWAVYVAGAALLVCAIIIVHGFFTHNVAIEYVAHNYPTDTGSLFWLYQLAGLWASRSGSLLTWALLITAFAVWVAWHARKRRDDLTNVALMVVMIVLLFFIAVMLFSQSNNPWIPTDKSLIDADGNLLVTSWGMNVLLEHWAMALHPPTLFLGYAGMTIPFAFAIAALICKDTEGVWIERINRIALFAFIFLTAGIGLGAVWAYVVLGWGGYWGWDPVENASLLSWLTAVAMIHSFTIQRKRKLMHVWCLFTVTLTFVFVVLGTFITRSGLVESVHAFDEDPVSTYLFLAMMICALAAFAIPYALHRKDYMVADDIESVFSKNGSYYLTNVIMVFAGILLAYLTISSALPTWMPAGGMIVLAPSYETVARPLGILVCALAAVCPFLGWKKSDKDQFFKNVRIPLIAAAALFVFYMVILVTQLIPAYNASIAQGDEVAENLINMGPAWYYHRLAVVGFAVSSLLFANSLYLIIRGVRGRMQSKSESAVVALGHLFAKSPAQAGGYLTHMGLGIVLAGLIGSAMYVTNVNATFNADEPTVQVGAYTVTYVDDTAYTDNANNRFYTLHSHIEKDGKSLGDLETTLEFTAASYYNQARYKAEVITFPFEDFFLAFQGYEYDDSVVCNIRINPLILFVWVGFAIMTCGIACATWPKRYTPLIAQQEGQAQ